MKLQQIIRDIFLYKDDISWFRSYLKLCLSTGLNCDVINMISVIIQANNICTENLFYSKNI